MLVLWLVSLSLSFFCWSVVLLLAVVAFLFLFSSGAGETQAVSVCGSPCVDPAALFFLDPYSRHRTYIKAYLPHLLFLFLVWFRCRRFALSLSLSFSLSLSLSLSLWFRSPRLCMQMLKNTLGWPTRRRPHYYHDCFDFFLGREHRTVARTDCPELSVLPPFPPAVP